MANGRLSTLQIKALSRKGRFGDGNGLYLQVSPTGSKAWLFRYMRNGRAHEMGLGTVAIVPLAKARQMAQDCRRLLAEGTDPLQARQAHRQAQDAPRHTFNDVASLYLDAHRAGWSNKKHAAQWSSSLSSYVLPVLGGMDVADITTGDVLNVLRPLWEDKTETASRVRGRIEAILSYAKALGWRSGENPAAWKDNLQPLLPARGRVAPVVNHPALPWPQTPAFMGELRQREGMAARALEFLVLTGTRTGETLGATWQEIDLETKTWTIPAARMKANREHRVPLSDAALAVLRQVQPATPQPDAYVFPGTKRGAPLSDMALTMTLRRMNRSDITAHGMRSTFRDWAAEATSHPDIVAEMALAHSVSDKVEAAYRRGDLFVKRQALMADWAQFLTSAV